MSPRTAVILMSILTKWQPVTLAVKNDAGDEVDDDVGGAGVFSQFMPRDRQLDGHRLRWVYPTRHFAVCLLYFLVYLVLSYYTPKY